MSLNSQGFEFHLQLAKMYLSKKKKRHCEKSKFLLPELLKNVITVLLKVLSSHKPPFVQLCTAVRNRDKGTEDQRRAESLKLSAIEIWIRRKEDRIKHLAFIRSNPQFQITL